MLGIHFEFFVDILSILGNENFLQNCICWVIPCPIRVFFLNYCLATSTTNWVKIYIGLLFYGMCWDTPSENNGPWQKVSSYMQLGPGWSCDISWSFFAHMWHDKSVHRLVCSINVSYKWHVINHSILYHCHRCTRPRIQVCEPAYMYVGTSCKWLVNGKTNYDFVSLNKLWFC